MTRHDQDGWMPPAAASTNLHLPARDGARVDDMASGTTVLRLGDTDAEVTVFARSASSAREVAEAATAWADLREARERGEDVELWGAWVVPSDTFRGPR
jgi:hypothetical protein